MQSGEKCSHQNKKKFRPLMNRAGRIQKKYELGIRNISPGPRSTSPDSPVHNGAAAKPMPVVRANPMYHHLEGLEMDDDHFPFSVRTLGNHL